MSTVKNVAIIAVFSAVMIASTSAFAAWDGKPWATVDMVTIEYDSDTWVRLTGDNTWYKLWDSNEDYKQRTLSILLTAKSTGREVKIYTYSNTDTRVVKVIMR